MTNTLTLLEAIKLEMAARPTRNIIGRDKDVYQEYRPTLVPWLDQLIESGASLALATDRLPRSDLQVTKQYRIDNQGYIRDNDSFSWYNLQIQLNIPRNVSYCSKMVQFTFMLTLSSKETLPSLPHMSTTKDITTKRA